MIRLQKNNNKNGPKDYDKIFQDRAKKGPDWQDVRRWKELLRYDKGGPLIDLGCLDSNISEYRKEVGIYIGIDKAMEVIDVRQKMAIDGEYYVVADIINTNYPTDRFSYAVLGEVLEHLEEPEKAIKEAYRILKPGGTLAISVPLEEVREPGAVDSLRHLWSFSKEDFTHLLKDFKQVKMKVLRSQYFPRYRYAWPTLIVYAKK